MKAARQTTAGTSKELGTSFDFYAPSQKQFYKKSYIYQAQSLQTLLLKIILRLQHEWWTGKKKKKSPSSMGSSEGCFLLSIHSCAATGPSLTDKTEDQARVASTADNLHFECLELSRGY